MKYTFAQTGVLSLMIWSPSAYALFDAEVFYGQSRFVAKFTAIDATEKSVTVKSTEMAASLLLDPIPVVPFAFGLMALKTTTNLNQYVTAITDDLSTSPLYSNWTFTGKGESNTTYYGPVIKIWAPIPKLTPYIKAAYLIGVETQTESIEGEAGSSGTLALALTRKPITTYKHTDTEVTFGLGVSPLKKTQLFLEYTVHAGRRTATALSGSASATIAEISVSTPYTSADLSDANKKEQSFSATCVRIGLGVGI